MKSWLTVMFLMLVTFQAQAKMRYFDSGKVPEHEVTFAAPDSRALVVYGVSDVPFGGWLSSSKAARVGAGIFVGIRDNYDVPESNFLVNDLLTLRIGYIQRLKQTHKGAVVKLSHMPLLIGLKAGPASSNFYFSGELGLSWLWDDCSERTQEASENYVCDDMGGFGGFDGVVGAAAFGLGYELGALDMKAEVLLPNLSLISNMGPGYSQKSIMLNLGYKFYSY